MPTAIPAGERMHFDADDGIHGQELRSDPLAAAGAWVAEPFGLGCSEPEAPERRIVSEGVPAPGSGLDPALDDGTPFAAAGLERSWSPASIVLGGGCELLLVVLRYPMGTGTAGSLGRISFSVSVPADPVLLGAPSFGPSRLVPGLGVEQRDRDLAGRLIRARSSDPPRAPAPTAPAPAPSSC